MSVKSHTFFCCENIIFTSINFLCILRLGPISQSLCACQVVHLGLIQYSSLLGPFLSIEETKASWVHSLFTKKMKCPHNHFTSQLIGSIYKLRRTLCDMSMFPGITFTSLNFLSVLLMVRISWSVCICQAFLSQRNSTLQLTGSILILP